MTADEISSSDVPEDASSLEAEEQESAEPEIDTSRMDWYVVHVYSGYENKAKFALEERIKSLGKQEFFGEILVPEEEVQQRTSAGQIRQVKKRFYPGYMLCQMELDNETWHVVKDTPKVMGFVGGDSQKPPKVPPHEVEKVKGQLSSGQATPKPKMEFIKGEAIRVVEGPFANFNGTVDEVRPEKGKLRVMVSIFGRATPVELDFIQVQKA
jgi:transcriptional antiterminator NusG